MYGIVGHFIRIPQSMSLDNYNKQRNIQNVTNLS